MCGGIGVTEMINHTLLTRYTSLGGSNIEPMLPIGVLVTAFVLAVTATAFFTIKNKGTILEKIFKIVRLSVIYGLVLIIGLRPVTIETNYEFSAKNLDVLFVVDGTISMWAQDYEGYKTRIEGVRADVKYIIDELAGSSFGLVTFDDTAHVLSPYTQDMKYIKDTIDVMMMPDSYYALGSSLSVPYKDMEALLQSSNRKDNRKTVVFFLSDGEVTNSIDTVSYEALQQYVDSGAVLGYGSENGGKMKEGYDYLYDPNTGTDAISRIDEENLKKIAKELDVQYINVNGGNTALAGLIEVIKQQSTTIVEQGDGAERYVDTYYYYAAALAIMLLLEGIIFVRKTW